MCGILGVVSRQPVNQLLYDGLLLLQHRGQDAAGIATADRRSFSLHKGNGLVRDVFRTRNMRSLPGHFGVAHVRYPTAGSASNSEEAQPFYVNAPFGIMLGHNGNLTNAPRIKEEMRVRDLRHINTNSDSEVLLNVLAFELQAASGGPSLEPSTIFKATTRVMERVEGAYACVAQIAGYGILAFRDPNGIRPLCYGVRETDSGTEYMVASESVALEGLGFHLVRDVKPGEAVFIDFEGHFYTHECVSQTQLSPCIFEYVYFARPDSVIDGASVYASRLKMGEYLAREVASILKHGEIDVVMPIPDTSRPAALELANHLNLKYREGFFKNRYVGRTFIMPGQAVRKKSVRQKLNAMSEEFRGKNVLLVDDSIVRGTTSQEIVQMAREAGANRVYMASAAAPVRFPNVYGIDMPTRSELIAFGRDTDQICQEIGADALVYQKVESMGLAVSDVNPALKRFDTSCFDGTYLTAGIDARYLDKIEAERHVKSGAAEDEHERGSINLQFASNSN